MRQRAWHWGPLYLGLMHEHYMAVTAPSRRGIAWQQPAWFSLAWWPDLNEGPRWMLTLQHGRSHDSHEYDLNKVTDASQCPRPKKYWRDYNA